MPVLHSPVTRDVLSPLPEIRNGTLQLPTLPRLGMQLNEEAAADHPGMPYDRPIIIQHDGSVGLE